MGWKRESSSYTRDGSDGGGAPTSGAVGDNLGDELKLNKPRMTEYTIEQ